jgi:alpha-beta hydrolase superfamily lysophospholipase
MTAITTEEFEFAASDGTHLHCYRFTPKTQPRAAVHIAHGMGEHAARYDVLGHELAAAGYLVVADDHRGHGRTAPEGTHGDLGRDGWNRVVADFYEINQHLSKLAPGVPKVLLGHSMGAMLSQLYVNRHGDSIEALVLSGSPGIGTAFALWTSHTIARFERWRLGHDGASALMDRLLFGAANEPFEGETGFEWLSRDAEAVQRYVDDPNCGFVLRVGSLCDLFAGSRAARKPAQISRIPKSLPVFVLSGAADPVHGEGKGLARLIERYNAAGLTNVTHKLYPDGRHEMFNETNRDEVVADLLGWLDTTLSRR